MATFYKYAERSAESQVNWAEIGKDMTDMLRQEVAVRDQKKAAIDEATRKLSQEVANAPQGESVSAKEEAIRLADQVTKYMLQQERLLKGGLLDPKDYMVARQNLTDGTRQAYQTMKDFQAKYGELMEGVRKGTTSIISVKELEKIQGYGNFRQSGFFIDSPTGKLNVGLKEEQIIDGEKVIGLKPGSTVGMQYLLGGIYGVRDTYDYRKDIMELSNSLGEEIRVTLDPGTLSTLGSAKTLSDLRQRVVKIATEDPTREKELFNFYDSMEKALGGYLVNENNLGSLLADTMGYEWTDNPEEAKKNPNTVLGGVDPNTGQPSLEFTDKNKQDAADFMMQQFLGTIKVEEKVQGMGQPQLQERRPRTEAEIGRSEKKADATNVAENLIFATTGDANQSDAGTKFLTGLTGLPFKKLKDGISITDEDGNLQTFKLRADGKTLADPLGFIKSFIGPITRKTGLNQEDVLREVKRLLPQGAQLNETTVASGFDEQAEEQAPLDELNTIVSESIQTPKLTPYLQKLTSGEALTEQFNKFISPKLSGVKFDYNAAGNVFVDVNGVESAGYKVGDPAKNKAALKNMQDFIIKTYAKGGTAEEQEMAAEAVLSLFPKTSRKTGGVMGGY
jgi:hypothetical protein